MPCCSLQAQLAEMETRANLKAQRERDLKGAGDVEKGRKSLAEVNRQNALKNMENALKNVSSRPEGSRTLTSDGVDPFSRRPTRPMTYWKTRKDDVPGSHGLSSYKFDKLGRYQSNMHTRKMTAVPLHIPHTFPSRSFAKCLPPRGGGGGVPVGHQ